MRDKRRDQNQGDTDERYDDLLRDTLTPLRQVGMSADARTAAQRRIHAALADETARYDRLCQAWWCRRVSVPLPVAAGLVLFLGILGMLQLRQLRSPYPPSRREIASSPGPAPAQQSRPQYYEEAVYVTGLGYVNSESGYRFFEENAHEVGQIRSNSLPLDSWRPGTGVARAAGPVPCGGPAGGPEIL